MYLQQKDLHLEPCLPLTPCALGMEKMQSTEQEMFVIETTALLVHPDICT